MVQVQFIIHTRLTSATKHNSIGVNEFYLSSTFNTRFDESQHRQNIIMLTEPTA